jgi:hypothetical protein
MNSIRVHRGTVVREIQASDTTPDYRDSFELTTSSEDTRSAEQWMRAAFEGAPRPVRWFLLLGWRLVLGLRLGPLSAPDYILGWRIASREHNEVRIELQSALMRACLTLHLAGSMAVWHTNVYYIRPMARLLWEPVGVIHRQVVPYLLKRATSLRI